MFGWAIVPKGTGDLNELLGIKPDATVCIELSIFLSQEMGQQAYDALSAPQREKNELRRIGIIFP